MSFITNAIGNLVGSITGANQQAAAAQTAAATQASASNYAAGLQNQQFQQLQTNLAPYMSLGISAAPQLLTSLGYTPQVNSSGQITGLSGQGFQFNPSNLDQTPGYQFTLNQGLQQLQNANSATGQNLSGAQQKGMASYITGLADQTYNQQYQNALQTYTTNATQLSNLLNLGQNSAVGSGQAGMTGSAAVGNALTSGANATAAGQIAAGNTQTNSLNSLMGLGLAGAKIYSLLS